jgi:hypothetical protein
MNTEPIKNNNDTIVLHKKRGRKSKKEIEIANSLKSQELISQVSLDICHENNINITIEETNEINDNINGSVSNESFGNEDIASANEKPAPKKRGRKPKGGKIIQHIIPFNNNKETKPNVILHLKCSIKDLQNTPNTNYDIQSYTFENTNQLSYDELSVNKKPNINIINETKIIDDDYDIDDESCKENDIKDIWKKLKVLEYNLHVNNICDKKSACFWCTCDFDNPPVYIPKFYIKDTYNVYGCFCSPECATAYLMEENIDSSSKFERYHFLNHIYSKIFNYKKNIKPAPNPYYMLEKYYGNLTIQEYRALLRNERLFLIVDKPLTRILPELHEDNDDFIINNKIIPSNAVQMKNKLQKKQNKINILNERFGLAH